MRWQINRQGAPISGYNIYIAESPEAPGDLYNSAPYPGDTDGDPSRESIELAGLENGKTYYAYIRTVLSDGSLSQPSEKISFLPLDQGRIIISSNYLNDKSGYSFAKHYSMVARHNDNDFYIYANGTKMGISSPSRMHTSLNHTRIRLEGKPGSPDDSTQPLSVGATYLIELADGGQARLTVINIRGVSPDINVTFDYIYYPPGILP